MARLLMLLLALLSSLSTHSFVPTGPLLMAAKKGKGGAKSKGGGGSGGGGSGGGGGGGFGTKAAAPAPQAKKKSSGSAVGGGGGGGAFGKVCAKPNRNPNPNPNPVDAGARISRDSHRTSQHTAMHHTVITTTRHKLTPVLPFLAGRARQPRAGQIAGQVHDCECRDSPNLRR